LEQQIQIYKSEQRGYVESDIFRRFCIFNFDDYRAISRNGFGSLQAVNDETLAAGNKIIRHIDANTDILFLPLVGGIAYKDSLGNHDIIGTGQLRVFSATKGMSYEIINLYEEELVNYLQIWLRPNKPFSASQSNQKDFNLKRNALVPLFEGYISDDAFLKTNTGALGFIGIFDGRQQGGYTLKKTENGLFVFVIHGAFEFEDRLIENRDGLSLAGVSEVTFEALSENAIVLILEVPLR